MRPLQKLGAVLRGGTGRATHWLKLAGCCGANARLAATLPAIHFPPEALFLAAYNHSSYQQYYESGLAQARFIMETMRRYKPQPELVIGEWGCGPARIIQHLPALDSGLVHLVGIDCDPGVIDWCRQTFPAIDFLRNNLAPPLALADQSLDVLYCCAVFSHLAESLQHAWLAEIRRVLKPGGLLIATFQGDGLRDRLSAEELALYDAGELVVRAHGREGSRDFLTFSGDNFVRQRLLADFAGVNRLDAAPFVQTVWCATAPASTLQTGGGAR